MGYTAFIIILYTLETAAMREELVRQTELQLRPFVVGNSDRGELVLVNVGHGTAVNIDAKPAVLKDPVLERKVGIRVYPPQIMQLRDYHRLDTREPFSFETGEPVSRELFAGCLTPRHATASTELTIEYDRVDGRHRYRSVIEVAPQRVRLLKHERIERI